MARSICSVRVRNGNRVHRRPLKPGENLLNMDAMQVSVNPREEWKQMYQEVWRIERDYFYAKNYHGLDLAAAGRSTPLYFPES